jgi:hypothetical protein
MMIALTGVSKMMDRVDLRELRQDAAVPYEYALPKLFDKTVTVYNYHNPDMPLSRDLDLEVRWQEDAIPGNALQDAQADQIRIEQGTDTPEEIRARRQGIPVDEVVT